MHLNRQKIIENDKHRDESSYIKHMRVDLFPLSLFDTFYVSAVMSCHTCSSRVHVCCYLMKYLKQETVHVCVLCFPSLFSV